MFCSTFFWFLVHTATSQLQLFLAQCENERNWNHSTTADQLGIPYKRYILLYNTRDPLEEMDSIIYLSRCCTDDYPFCQEALQYWHECFMEALICAQAPYYPATGQSANLTVLQKLCWQGKISPLTFAVLYIVTRAGGSAKLMSRKILSVTDNNYNDADISNALRIIVDYRITL